MRITNAEHGTNTYKRYFFSSLYPTRISVTHSKPIRYSQPKKRYRITGLRYCARRCVRVQAHTIPHTCARTQRPQRAHTDTAVASNASVSMYLVSRLCECLATICSTNHQLVVQPLRVWFGRSGSAGARSNSRSSCLCTPSVFCSPLLWLSGNCSANAATKRRIYRPQSKQSPKFQ